MPAGPPPPQPAAERGRARTLARIAADEIPMHVEPELPGPGEAARREAKRCPTCGERFPVDYLVCPRDVIELDLETDEDFDPYLGTTLAETYRIVHRIGIGGMGSVYEATHVRLPAKRYAVKIMHDELARKPELVTRFRREAEVAGLAAHPNCVEVFDTRDTPEGIPFIVAELLEGEDLGQRLDREGRLPLATTVEIILPLCAALQSAHRVGIVHRDLKPDNVFLVTDPPPVVKLLDFGIARLTDPATGNRTRTGVVMGTPAYMSPEQARGEHVDHRCDVYAVGAIVYHCLTGRPVFDDPDPAATLTAVLTREPDRPRAVQPDIPEAAELVIERALARNVAERYQSMAELDAALRQLVDVPVAAGPAAMELAPRAAASETTLAARSQVKRARPTIATMTAIAVVLAVGILSDLLARLLAAGGSVSGTEGGLIVLGVLAAIGTPTGLWIRWLRRRVWANSMRAVTLAHRLTVAVAAGATSYAVVLVAARLGDLGVSTSPTTTWGPLAPAVASAVTALAVLAAVWLTRRPRREAG